MGVALAYELVFGDDASEAVNVAVNIGMGLAFAEYSRDNERQADQYGIHYMVKAGYDPNGALGMFDKLAAMGDHGSSNVFEQLARSHPETQERIQNAKRQIQEMMPLPPGLTFNEAKYQSMLQRLPKKQG
jgi:predicted Zn-dependent protease